ncbi:LCP family protein [Candidatus Saccharibacteria bacterium]|nr:LCP family protein [Candidatus Saccharibacteria bacterium]
MTAQQHTQLARYIPASISLILLITFAVASYSVWHTAILPAKYLWLGLLLAGSVAALLSYICLWRWPKHLMRRGFLLLLTLAYLTAGAYTTLLARSAAGFLHASQVSPSDSISYVLVTSAAKPQSDFSEVGFMRDDTLTDKAFGAFMFKPAPMHTAAPELTTLLVRVVDEGMPGAILRSAQLRIVQDNNPSLFSELRVIRTVTVTQQAALQTSQIKPGEPFVLYISGIDTYGDVSTVSRSDVNILAAVNPRTHKIVLVNTPRDYYVQLHGTTGLRDKLTHAGIYGIDMSRQTLEDLYGIPIDHYVRINFTSLTRTIDTLGGVDVQSPYDFSVGSYDYTTGSNHLGGDAALAFARERHSFEEGDRVRGQNQQRVIEAIIAKLNNPRNLLSFQQVLGSVEGSFETSIAPENSASLIRAQLNDMHAWSVQSLSVNGTGDSQPTYSMGDLLLYVMQPNESSIANAQTALREILQP